VSALLWLLFAWSTWAQPATVELGTTSDVAAFACVPFVGESSSRYCLGEYEI
jgi:hypothetical protein